MPASPPVSVVLAGWRTGITLAAQRRQSIMHAAGHAMSRPLNNLPALGRRALREFSSAHGVPSMIYQAYRTQAAYLDLMRPLAAAAGSALHLPWPRLGQDWPLHTLAGVLETFANLTVSHARLPFGIDSVQAGTQLVPVTEDAVYSTPFATLLRFNKATGAVQPRVLLVAPMSGHFATLLRATVKTMLTGHDVYITDWNNIRDVPLAEGRFDFSAFVDH